MSATDAQGHSPSGLLPRNILPSVSVDYVGRACGKAVSEDFFDASCPDAAALAQRGIVFALADGVSGGGGRRAAETCVGGVLSDYYAAPIEWPVAQCLDRVIGALNSWLAAHNHRSDSAQSMLSTLTVLVLRGGEFHVAHVGDCRLYRARAGAVECLTTDHLWPRRDMRHVLRRAVGLDRHLVVDFFVDELRPGDRFALLSDGVWEVLGGEAIRQSLAANATQAARADELVARSLATQRAYYGRNDATAAIIEVLALPV